jgi:Na+-translocating ferredoxin:NAD+ oxidoreductase RnfC subunit
MKILQLFRKKIEGEDLLELLKCFGLVGLDDTHVFTKYELRQRNTCVKLQSIMPMLKEYYLPCKANLYITEIFTEAKAITILRQILRVHSYTLVSIERNINHEKQIFYCAKRMDSCSLSYSSSNVLMSLA